MADQAYWQALSSRLTGQYRALQGVYDAIRHEGSPEMLTACSTALDAVWTLIAEADRRAKAEARHEVAEAGDPCHQRQRRITQQHADHSGSRLFAPTPLDQLFG